MKFLMWLLMSTKKQLFKLFNSVTFLSADEAAERSNKNCPFASRKEIDEVMRETCSRGERTARFFRKRIDEATKQELIDLGHKIEEGELEKVPYFYVIW